MVISGLTKSAEAWRGAAFALLLLPALGPSAYLLLQAAPALAQDGWLAHFIESSLPHQALTSAWLAVEALAIALVAGVPPALAVARRQFPLRWLMTPLMLTPLLFAPYATVGLWTTGFASSFWEGRHALALQQGMACAPYVFIVFRLAAARLPSSMSELAAALGKNPWQRAVEVQLPLLAVPLAASSLIVLAFVLGDYAAAARMGVPTLAVGIHTLWLASQSSTVAAVICTVLIVPTLLMVALGAWAGTRWISQNPPNATASRVLRKRLPFGGALALWASVAAVVGVGWAVPQGLVVLGLKTAAASRTRWASLPDDAWNAVGTAAGTAAAVTVLALALLVLLRLGARRGAQEPLPWLYLANFFLPPLVLALAFLMMSADGTRGAALLGPARDSRLLICVAEALRFFPLLLLPLLDALRRTPPSHMELARALGDGPWGAWLRALRGPVLPAFALGVALVLLESLKSLDLSLTLQAFGYSAPPLKVYAFSREQMMDRAAPWILVTQALMVPAWAYLSWRLQRMGEHAQT